MIEGDSLETNGDDSTQWGNGSSVLWHFRDRQWALFRRLHSSSSSSSPQCSPSTFPRRPSEPGRRSSVFLLSSPLLRDRLCCIARSLHSARSVTRVGALSLDSPDALQKGKERAVRAVSFASSTYTPATPSTAPHPPPSNVPLFPAFLLASPGFSWSPRSSNGEYSCFRSSRATLRLTSSSSLLLAGFHRSGRPVGVQLLAQLCQGFCWRHHVRLSASCHLSSVDV